MESITSMQQAFFKNFGHAAQRAFTSCGRVELIGNHTDHQHGLVLAAGVNLSAVALAAPNDRDEIRLCSEGFPPCAVKLSELQPDPGEYGTTTALLRGVVAGISKHGGQPIEIGRAHV